MRNRFTRSAAGPLIVAAAFLSTGCGDRTAATANNSVSVLPATDNGLVLGNDASAMETVNNPPVTGAPQPATSNSAATPMVSNPAPAPGTAAGNRSATTPLAPVGDDSPPGGDTGGNSGQARNTPGL